MYQILSLLVLALPALCYKVPQSEVDGLKKFYDALDGDNWFVSEWFKDNDDPCSWYGLECTAEEEGTGIRHIESISLSNNNLKGIIPDSIAEDFPFMISLDMPSNNVTGPLPALPPKTYAISFRFNTVKTFPPNLCELTLLEYSHLDFNEIYDQIPSCFGKLSKLAVFGATHNKIYGQLPQDLGNLVKLETLMLGGNNIEGFIPEELYNLPLLQTLDLTGNKFLGELYTPGSVLKELDLGSTMISSDMMKLISSKDNDTKELLYLDVSNTNIQGDISDILPHLNTGKSLEKLRLLSLQNSHVYGVSPIPSEEKLREEEGSMIQTLVTDGCLLFCGEQNTKLINDSTENVCAKVVKSSVYTSSEENNLFTRLQVKLLYYPLGSNIEFSESLELQNLECADKNNLNVKYPAIYSGNNYEGSVVCNGVSITDIKDVSIFLNGTEITNDDNTQFIGSTEKINLENNDLISQVERRKGNENALVSIVATGMSKCPDFSGFLTKILLPSYSKIKELNEEYANLTVDGSDAISIDISFIVEQMDDYTTGIWSMHGQVEVIGDAAFECANQIGGTEMVMRLSECLYRTNEGVDEVPSNVETCFAEVATKMNEEFSTNYDPEVLTTCTYKDGFQLTIEGNKLARELEAVWSPTVYLNNEMICRYNAPGSNACQFANSDEFIQMIIDRLPEKQ